jgi:2-oxoglutarate ferredoxin oxidoreductase subunit gamma
MEKSLKSSRYEIRLVGSGGQGMVLAGIILAEAGILDGRYVAQSQSYGPEARGGNAASEVVLSDTEIDYGRTTQLDLLVALTQEACNRHLADLKPEGLVIVDSDLVHGVLWSRVVGLPFQRIAHEAGEERAVNMAALGAVAAFCPLVSRNSLVEAITKRLPAAKATVNILAFDNALKLALEAKKNLEPVAVEDSEI